MTTCESTSSWFSRPACGVRPGGIDVPVRLDYKERINTFCFFFPHHAPWRTPQAGRLNQKMRSLTEYVSQLMHEGINKNWRFRLLRAKAEGADDRTAMEYAGLTEPQFLQLLRDDDRLERDMLAARAASLVRHLKWMRTAAQWQAHEFALQKVWAHRFGDLSARPGKSRQQVEVSQAISLMNPEQLQRPGEVIRLGVVEDRKRRAQLPAPTT